MARPVYTECDIHSICCHLKFHPILDAVDRLAEKSSVELWENANNYAFWEVSISPTAVRKSWLRNRKPKKSYATTIFKLQ